jgi:hypothetical protein
MAKRFVDTSLWKRKWYRCLPPKMKLFYFYMITNCDHAGMYDVDLELAEFQIGMPVKQKDIDEHLKDHIKVIKDDKWWVKAFVDFQYGELKDTNNAHISVIKILNKYGILGADEGLTSSCSADQYKDKEYNQDSNKVKEKEKMNPDILKVSAAHKKTIGYREVMFKRKVSEFAEQYPKDMRVQFADYWTESGGNKLRFEKEKVFDVGRRLARWSKNNFNKKEETTKFKTDSTSKFFIAYCSNKKCSEYNKSDFYDKYELKQDSRCCQSKLMAKKQ